MKMQTIITTSERLILYRRRKKWTQTQSAHHFSVSRTKYQQWEHGNTIGPRVTVSNVKPLELYYLYRIREGWNQIILAKKLRCSRWWLIQMETGLIPHIKLANFWERYHGRAR